MKINTQIFKFLRRLTGITQLQLADLVNIDQSAIAHFEDGRGKLSDETVLRIIHALSLNKDYFEGNELNPFAKSTSVYKFFLRGKNMKADLKYLFQFLRIAAPVIGEIILLTTSASMKFKKMTSPTYAIAMNDTSGNIYLFRAKDEASYIADSGYLFDEIYLCDKISDHQAFNRPGQDTWRIKDSLLPAELYDKIRKFEVQKSDFDTFLAGYFSVSYHNETVSVDGKTILYPVPDIMDILETWVDYLELETDPDKREDELRRFMNFYLSRIKRVKDHVERSSELQRVLARWRSK